MAAGAISKNNSDDLKKNGFMRAARTDKGVHAAGNVVSLKMIVEDDDIVEQINHHLPESIRVWGVQRMNKSFDCKKMCGSRVYEYLMPSYVFLPPRPESVLAKKIASADGGTTKIHPFWTNIKDRISELSVKDEEALALEIQTIERKSREDFRISGDLLSLVRTNFKAFEGTHNFHNFTIGKDFSAPNAQRFIESIDVSEPMLINNTEWLSIKLHGQSFMLHQIRKMVAMVALVIRTNCPTSLITECFEATKINIPKAPSLGLLLEKPVYDGYNEQLVGKFGYAPISFEPFATEIEQFKQAYIYDRIFSEENEDHVFQGFFEYLDNFTIRSNDALIDQIEAPTIFDYLTNRKILTQEKPM